MPAKRVPKKSLGIKDQRAIDKAMLQNCKQQWINICMAWINFKKACNMVSHSQVLKCLQTFSVVKNVISLMWTSMPSCKTKLYTCGQPLLWSVCIRSVILSHLYSSCLLWSYYKLLEKLKIGYILNKEKLENAIHHLLFMDGLKLCQVSKSD